LRIALFGGTFDPVHNGHLTMAREAARRCALDRILLIPAGRPPHKSAGPYASYEDRLRMVELACEGDQRLKPSRLEEGEQKSYTIDTITKLRARVSPDDQLYFLIGADAFADIETWHRWREVVRAVEFIVVSRPHRHYEVPPEVRAHTLDDLEVATSSSDIRTRIARGDYDIDVPPAVLEYIKRRGLYRSLTSA
jgi:nicotinate-nucleotide adenylyltransferase